jgi:hypothetical protein
MSTATAAPSRMPTTPASSQPTTPSTSQSGTRIRQNTYARRSHIRPPGSEIFTGSGNDRSTALRRAENAYRDRRNLNRRVERVITFMVPHEDGLHDRQWGRNS